MARTVLVLFHKILANGNAAAVFLKLKGIGVSPAGYATREVPLKMFLRFGLLVVILSPVLNGVAQTITTYAGPPLPVLGALATTQYFDREIEASGPLNGYAIFRQRLPGLPDSEATTPLETIASSSMAFFFDNVAGFQTGIAVVNLSASETTVTAVFRDENGLQLGSSQFSIPRSGHSSFFLNSRFPTTANRRGIVEFQNQSGITGVGLRFSPSLSFTSVPVIR